MAKDLSPVLLILLHHGMQWTLSQPPPSTPKSSPNIPDFNLKLSICFIVVQYFVGPEFMPYPWIHTDKPTSAPSYFTTFNTTNQLSFEIVLLNESIVWMIRFSSVQGYCQEYRNKNCSSTTRFNETVSTFVTGRLAFALLELLSQLEIVFLLFSFS